MNRSPDVKKLEWRHFVVFVLAAFPWVSTAQMTVHGDDEDYTYESREGIEFGINIGAYRGDQLSPYFYDGSGDRTLAEGSGNAQIWSIDDRLRRLQKDQTSHPVSIILNGWDGSEPWQLESLPLMQYRTSMMFGLKMAKYWNPETALVCQLDALQMTAEGAWSLKTGAPPDQGQGNADIRTYPILGKEQRMLVSLGYRTAIYLAEDASWTLEFGGMANAISVERNYIVMTGEKNATYEVNLLTSLGNGTGPLTAANKLLTQWGTGFYASGGIDLAFDEGGHIELNARVSRDQINLGTQTVQGWNVALFVTWMMPSELGDFVRASF